MRVLPPLDGGMLALIAIQVLTRKPIPDYVQASLCKAGLGMMLLLSALAFIFEMVPLARFYGQRRRYVPCSLSRPRIASEPPHCQHGWFQEYTIRPDEDRRYECRTDSKLKRRRIPIPEDSNLNLGLNSSLSQSHRYWKWTPNAPSFRQMTLQAWGARPGMLNRNVEGMPKVAPTSRHAPDSDKLRTMHERCAFPPRIIVPDLSVRRR